MRTVHPFVSAFLAMEKKKNGDVSYYFALPGQNAHRGYQSMY